MCSSRSRCALAGALLSAAACVFASPTQVRAQGSFNQGVVTAIDQVVNLIAQSAKSGRHRADLGELNSALNQLLNVLEQPHHPKGDKWRHDEHHGDKWRHDEHHGHLWHGLGWAGHDRRRDDWKGRDEKKRFDGEGRRSDEHREHRNWIGMMPGRPAQTASARARTTNNATDVGHVKQGGGGVAGASEARRARTLAPAGENAGQQANPPGTAKQGAGPGNVQAKNGSFRKSGNAGGIMMANNQANTNAGANRFGNAKDGNQANAAPMNKQGNPNPKPKDWDRKDEHHHHHHHHHFGEAKGAGQNGMGQARHGDFGKSKHGTGPQANQVGAKNGNGAGSSGSVAKTSSKSGNGQAVNNPSRAAGNNQAANGATAKAKTNATQAYVNHLMFPNGARPAQQNHKPMANNAQKPQGNTARPATQQSAGGSMMRSFHGFSNHAQVHAGNSVGHRSAGHAVHTGKR